MLKKIIFLHVFLLFINCYKSQEQITFKKDLYSGINGVTTDPTLFLSNTNPWDANIIGVDAFVNNNYAFIANQSVIGFLNNTSNLTYTNNVNTTLSANNVDFYSKNNYNGFASVDLLGPSVAFKTKIKERDFAFGIFSRARIMASAFGIPKNFYYQNFSQNLYDNFKEISPFKTSGADWLEFGVNSAYKALDDGDKQIHLGLNLKYNLGYDGGFINSKDQINVMNSNNNASISGYNVEGGFASVYDYKNNTFSKKSNGKGMAVDLGITFVTNAEKNEDKAYQSRLNISILDLGYVNFSGETHLFKGNPIIIDKNRRFSTTNNLDDFIKETSYKVYGDSLASYSGNKFTIGLPTSLAINYSKALENNKYINFGFSQRLPVLQNSLKKANFAYVTYSSQKEAIGYGATLSLYEYVNPQFGAYLRLGPLYFGSDNLLPVIFKTNKLHAFDFFAGLKFYPFWDNDFKRHRRKKCNC